MPRTTRNTPKKPTRRDEKVTATLTQDEAKGLDAYAEAHAWTRSTAMREILRAALTKAAS